MSTFRRLLGVSLIAVLCVGMAMAQSGTSSVRGTIVDPQNSVIPNATVTLTSPTTGTVRTQKSGPAGTFSFDLVTPGTYKLEASAPNFKKAVLDRVEALIDRPTDLSLQLQVGAANESITVESESSSVQVNTVDSSLGNNFVNNQITELPMEARNVLSLLTLQPGVTGSPNAQGYVAGARSDQSNITLDGVNVNDQESNRVISTGATSATGGPVLRLNSDAIQEFRVATMGSDASSGRSSGAQIQLVTKGGTNEFHGAAFDYNRNTIFTANNWFNNHNGVKRPALIRNTFGASFGGPIIKNKLFFFYSYEGRQDRSQQVVTARTVPLPSLAQGNIQFKNSLGNVVSIGPADLLKIFPDTNGVNPNSLKALAEGASYTANSTSVGDGLNTSGFTFNAAAPVHLNSHVAKFDYAATSKQQYSIRLNAIYDHDGTIGTPQFPGKKAPSIWSHPQGGAVSQTWTLTNNLISNFHYGFTRQAFSQQGDTTGNFTYLRIVYQPTAGTYDQSRVTPVHNFVEDLSWVRGNHTFQFGGNITLVNNNRINFGSSYDIAYTNPSGYKTNLIRNSVNNYLQSVYGYTISSAFNGPVENAVTALIGRFTSGQANFQFGHNGSLLAQGTPTQRDFATQGYEGYFQDQWRIHPNLTLTAGLRYNLWRPVYETHGFEVTPQIPLGKYFQSRIAAMNQGQAYTTDIVVNLSGPANNGPSLYPWQKTNFLPRVGVAWAPKTGDSGLWANLFGKNGTSVIRGGFSMVDDYFGESIATFFDTRNTLGFSSSSVLSVNTYNLGCSQYVTNGNPGYNCKTAVPGPLFTYPFGQDVRAALGFKTPANLVFPQQKADQTTVPLAGIGPTGIESSLDSALTQPKNYAVSLTYEREMPGHGLLQVSYLGRFGRNLLAQVDVATPANLKDPKSGMDYYTAATILEKARQAGVPISQVGVSGGTVAPIPFFENLFPLAGLNAAQCPKSTPGCNVSSTQSWYRDAVSNVGANDWTTIQLDFDGLSNIGPHAFYQPQYGALDAWSTVAYSNYHALAMSYRERLKYLTLDFNYTYSHSLDDASGLQSGGSFSGASLILNPFRPQDNYASSDFDIRHQFNVNSVWELPFGRGHALGNGANGFVNALIGGWQLSHIFRWNSGLPVGTPIDANTWSTNWENQSETTVINKAGAPISGCSSRLVKTPQFFGNCEATAFASFRNSYPGETGQRGYFRYPMYIDMDMGLGKTWKMPYNEHHDLQFRWETFNLTNTQEMGSLAFGRTGWGILPGSTAPSPDFSNWGSIQGSPRVMQFGLRYSF